MTREIEHCPNCGAALTGDYCSRCGQKAIDLDRPLIDLLGEVIRETFEVDGRAYRTLRALLLHPGLMTREFLAGRRRRYTPPLRLYLFVSIAFFVIAGWAVGSGVLLEAGQGSGEAERQAAFLSDVLPKIMFVLLPVFALLLRLLFRGRRYFAHLIHALHIHTLAYIVLAFVIPLERETLEAPLLAATQAAFIAYLLGWILLSLRVVYEQSWPWTICKALVLLLGQLAFITITADLSATALAR